MPYASPRSPLEISSELRDLQQLVHDYGITDGSSEVAISYGSVAMDGSLTSDLDMLILEPGDSARTPQDKAEFIDGLVYLHARTGRAVDEEVPFDNKLFYSPKEASEALSLEMFPRGSRGEIIVPELQGMQDGDPYFASREMKLRLFLNAFTTTHVFLGGDPGLYGDIREQSALSLRQLAGGIATANQMEAPGFELSRDLLLGPAGMHYKDFLGYRAVDDFFIARLRSAFRLEDSE